MDGGLEALRRELRDARRHLGKLLGVAVPLEPEYPAATETAGRAALAQEAQRLWELAERAGGRAERVAERVRRVEAELGRGPYPTV